MIRVVLADDQTLVREGLRSLLSLVPDISVVSEAGSGEEAIAAVLEHAPDVLLLDMRMPKGDGLSVINALREKEKLPPTLILTTFDDDATALEVVRAGARGFLLKDVRLEKLVSAVRTLAEGGTLVQPALTARAEKELGMPQLTTSTEDTDITSREREVLRLLAAGCSNKEIAKTLFLAEGTVKNHVSNILAKMGVRDRLRAVLKAAELGYL